MMLHSIHCRFSTHDFFYKSAFYPKTIAELNVIMNNYKVKKIFTLALTT